MISLQLLCTFHSTWPLVHLLTVIYFVFAAVKHLVPIKELPSVNSIDFPLKHMCFDTATIASQSTALATNSTREGCRSEDRITVERPQYGCNTTPYSRTTPTRSLFPPTQNSGLVLGTVLISWLPYIKYKCVAHRRFSGSSRNCTPSLF